MVRNRAVLTLSPTEVISESKAVSRFACHRTPKVTRSLPLRVLYQSPAKAAFDFLFDCLPSTEVLGYDHASLRDPRDE